MVKKLNMNKKIIMLVLLVILSALTSCNNNVSKEAVYNTNISNEELEKVFKEYTPKLDGAYAEGYSSKLYEAYKKSAPKQFIEVLSTNEIYNIEGIIKLFVGEMFIDGDKGISELEMNYEDIKKQQNLNQKEKYAVYEVLAQIQYFKESLGYKK